MNEPPSSATCDAIRPKITGFFDTNMVPEQASVSVKVLLTRIPPEPSTRTTMVDVLSSLMRI
jgi:hypothetical protein